MAEPNDPPKRFRFGIFEADAETGELRKYGARVKLHGQPFHVLTLLLERPGQVVTRQELRDALWPSGTFVDYDHSLNEAVNKLRTALGDSSASPRFVETVPRRGYRFLAPVDTIFPVEPPEPTGVANGSAERAGALHRPGTWRRPVSIGMAVALVVLLIVVGFVLRGGRRQERPKAPEGPIDSIAVLPLVNLSGDATKDYFADGMTQELISSLAKIESLRVISRTSVARYKGTTKPLPVIARELDVRAILEGAVLLEEDRVRLNVQLIYAPTDRTLWAETYDRDLRDVLALQSDLAMMIAEMIEVRLTPSEEAVIIRAARVDPQAYRAYLRGRFYWGLRSEEGAQRAIEQFRQALEHDPDYAPAYSGLADAYQLLAVYNAERHQEMMPMAKAAAEKALELDPRLAEAHASLGVVELLYEWNWSAAERELLTAIDLNPGYAAAHQWYGIYLVAMGRTVEARASLRRAQTLDPLSSSISENLGWVAYCAGDYTGALTQLRKTLEQDPRFAPALHYLALTYFQLERPREAVEILESARESIPWSVELETDLALAYARAGQRAEGARRLDQLLSASEERYLSPYLPAVFYAGIGDTERALEWLERAYQERAANLVFLKVEPLFDSMRDDPRFQRLVERVGLAS